MIHRSTFQNQQNHSFTVKQDFRIKNIRLTNSCPREKTNQTQSYSRTSTSRPLSILSQSRNLTLWQKNQKFHQKRRQSQLNSMFRIRKQKLEAITKFNKELYIKINTQESHYTSRQTSKQKDPTQKAVFTFKTVDSAQSRQILGPITNFDPIFRPKQPKLTSRIIKEKQNTPKQLQALNSSRNFNDYHDDCTPLRIKLGMKNNAENQENRPLTQRSPEFKTLNQSFQFQSFMKTPQRLSKLPQIYSFF